jgi:predicted Zn-dependent protease
MTDRISKLKALLEDEPDDPFLLYSLGHEYAKAGDAANALAFFDRTIAADADYCYAYYHKARVQQQSGDTAAARQTLETGLARALACKDQKAESEIRLYLDSLG